VIAVTSKLQYGVWYETLSKNCYTYVKAFHPPEQFQQSHQVAFIAHMIDAHDGHLSLYAPPKWQWKPNHNHQGRYSPEYVVDGRHPSGIEWLEFAEKQIETNQWKIANPQPEITWINNYKY